MTVCRVCGRQVSDSPFCEFCGAARVHRRSDGPDWLRIRHHCAAPAEHVLCPNVVSTLFPYLPRRSRRTFALAFLALLAILALLAALRWQAQSIGVAVFGFPVLLVSALVSSGVLRTVPRWTWITAALLGAGLGVGWAVVTGAWLSRSYGTGFAAGVAGGPNSASLGVPMGAVLLMATPAVVVRLMDSKPERSIDGLVVGISGATGFGVAATVVRLAPQLATGLVARQRSIDGLLVEAAIRGVVIPMTSAAIGGIAGVALWFHRRRGDSGRRRPLLVAAALGMVATAGGTALVEASGLGPRNEVLMHLVVTAVALYVLRLTVHLALLHEAPDPPGTDVNVRCPECGAAVSGNSFCPSCGLAAGARQSAPAEPWRALRPAGVGLLAAALCSTALSVVITKPVALYACPPECGEPPLGTAVQSSPRFSAADGSFSVSYPAEGTGYEITLGPSGVFAEFTAGDGGMLRLFGEPARGRSAEQVVHDFLGNVRPHAQRSYVIPNVMVGYRQGYGEVDDEYPVGTTGEYLRLRLVTVAAVHDENALIAAAIGPFHQFGPDFGPGPPSAVNLQIGLQMDRYVNSFRWRGDPEN